MNKKGPLTRPFYFLLNFCCDWFKKFFIFFVIFVLSTATGKCTDSEDTDKHGQKNFIHTYLRFGPAESITPEYGKIVITSEIVSISQDFARLTQESESKHHVLNLLPNA